MMHCYEAPKMNVILLESMDILTVSALDAGDALEKYWNIG